MYQTDDLTTKNNTMHGLREKSRTTDTSSEKEIPEVEPFFKFHKHAFITAIYTDRIAYLKRKKIQTERRKLEIERILKKQHA